MHDILEVNGDLFFFIVFAEFANDFSAFFIQPNDSLFCGANSGNFVES